MIMMFFFGEMVDCPISMAEFFAFFFLSAVNFFHKKIIDASQYSGSASAKPNYHDLEINIPKYGSTLLGSR